MKIEKCLYFLLVTITYTCVSSQNTGIYQPKTYTGLASVNGQMLYPGDVIIHTYSNSFLTISNSMNPVDKNFLIMSTPVLDAAYFLQEQVSAVPSQPAHRTNIVNYTITMKYTVKQVTQSTKVQLLEYSYGVAGDFPYDTGTNVLGSALTINVTCTLLPLPQGLALAPVPLLPESTGLTFDSEKLHDVTLYPGDIIKIKDFISTVYDSNQNLLFYHSYVVAYPHLFQVNQSSITKIVNQPISNYTTVQSYTDLYLQVKDTVQSDMVFTLAHWVGHPYGAFNQSYKDSYLNCAKCIKVALSPFPDFFNFANDSPELKKKLRPYISGKQGCTANAQNEDKRTPLMWSIFYCNRDLVKHFLADSLVTFNLKDKDGKTALMYAAQGNNKEIVNLLLAKELASQAIALQDNDGMTMLHYALWNNNYDSAKNILAIKSPTSFINIQNKWGITPLMYAAAQGNKQLVQLLLDQKADCTLVDKNGFNCLFYACLSLKIEVVKTIYEHLIAQDKKNAQKLLQAVALDQTNLVYNTLLKGTNDTDMHDVIEFLINNGVSPESSYDAQKSNQLQSYLQSPSMKRGVYDSALSYACSRGKDAQKTIELLLQAGARVTSQVIKIAEKNSVVDTIKNFGNSAGPLLYQAIYNGDAKTAVQIAQQFAPDVAISHSIANYTNSGWSVLFLLATQAKGNNVDLYNSIAQELIVRGANTSIVGPDQNGNPVTPLAWAVTNGNTNLQTILQKSGTTFSQSVANAIAIDVQPAITTTNLGTVKINKNQPSQLVKANVTQVNNTALVETVEPYDSLEYLLG